MSPDNTEELLSPDFHDLNALTNKLEEVLNKVIPKEYWDMPIDQVLTIQFKKLATQYHIEQDGEVKARLAGKLLKLGNELVKYGHDPSTLFNGAKPNEPKETAMKFMIGDKVKTLEFSPLPNLHFNADMHPLVGKVGEITGQGDYTTWWCVRHEEDRHQWVWPEHALELVEKGPRHQGEDNELLH